MGPAADEDKDEAFDGDQFNDENDDISGSDDDDEHPSKRRKIVGANGAPGAAPPSWNKARRERLKLALLRFGFGR
jgi:hypothetical protein